VARANLAHPSVGTDSEPASGTFESRTSTALGRHATSTQLPALSELNELLNQPVGLASRVVRDWRSSCVILVLHSSFSIFYRLIAFATRSRTSSSRSEVLDSPKSSSKITRYSATADSFLMSCSNEPRGVYAR
jgi:hypothetical protein